MIFTMWTFGSPYLIVTISVFLHPIRDSDAVWTLEKVKHYLGVYVFKYIKHFISFS